MKVVDSAVDMPCITMPMLLVAWTSSSRLEAPASAMDSETMVPNTPVRIRILLTYLAKLVRVLSTASRVAASAL